MDPPGGWLEVALDACTGRELGRTPSFSGPRAEDGERVHGGDAALVADEGPADRLRHPLREEAGDVGAPGDPGRARRHGEGHVVVEEGDDGVEVPLLPGAPVPLELVAMRWSHARAAAGSSSVCWARKARMRGSCTMSSLSWDDPSMR